MAALAGLIARFRKPLIFVIGALALLAVASSWSYSKGYGRAEDKYKALQVSALEAQKKEIEAAHAREVAALTKRSQAEHEARQIRNEPRPADPGCDAGTEWLQHLQGAVRRANGIAGAD